MSSKDNNEPHAVCTTRVAREWKELGSAEEIEDTKIKNERPLIGVKLDTSLNSLQRSVRLGDRNPNVWKQGYVSLLSTGPRQPVIKRKRVDTPVEANPEVKLSMVQTSLTVPADVSVQYDQMDAGISTNDDHITVIETLHSISSNKVEELISDNLLFDLYIDDYFKLSDEKVKEEKKQISVLDDYLCYADINISKNKVILCIAFHPTFTDIVALAYGIQSKYDMQECQSFHMKENIKEFSINAVTIWSLKNSMNPMFSLTCTHEVRTLQFSPYWNNLLVGGCSNGQIVLWDLKNKLPKSDALLTSSVGQEYELPSQSDNMPLKLSNAILPAITSQSDYNISCVINVQWFLPTWKMKSNGKLEETSRPDTNMQALSCSENGVIFVWEIQINNECHEKHSKHLDYINEEIENAESHQLYKALIPLYKLLAATSKVTMIPLSCMSNGTPFLYNGCLVNLGKDLEEDNHIPKLEIWLGSMNGQILQSFWEGVDFINEESTFAEEVLQITIWENTHDGPVESISISPFVKNMFLSTGGRVLAIWNNLMENCPLFWRKFEKRIGSCSWSFDSAGGIYISFPDGTIQIWDLIKSNMPNNTDHITADGCTGLLHRKSENNKSALFLMDSNGILKVYPLQEQRNAQYCSSVSFLENLCYKEASNKNDRGCWYEQWKKLNSEYLRKIKIDAEQKKMKHEQEIKLQRRKEIERRKAEEKSILLKKRMEQKMKKEELAKKKWLTQTETHIIEETLKIKHFDRKEILTKQLPMILLEEKKNLKSKMLQEILAQKSHIYDHTIKFLFPESWKGQIEKEEEIIEVSSDEYLKEVKQISCFSEYEKELLLCVKNNKFQHNTKWIRTVSDGKLRQKLDRDYQLSSINKSFQ